MTRKIEPAEKEGKRVELEVSVKSCCTYLEKTFFPKMAQQYVVSITLLIWPCEFQTDV